MQKIDVSKVIPMLADAAHVDDIDTALAPLLKVIDPNNEHDLGGFAGTWFSSRRQAWQVFPGIHRVSLLAQFFDHIDDIISQRE